MEPNRWSRLQALYAWAVELDPDRRRAQIEAECPGDPELAAEVLELLDDDDGPVPVLDELGAVAGELLEGPVHPGLGEGTRIGAFELVRPIGQGGSSDVWLARRADGAFEQQVALKLGRGRADPALTRRMVSERRILAALDHPNVARILDGGTAPDGSLFVAMEHVDGPSIVRYADAEQLGLTARIELFAQVVDAVGFAHRNLIVHRDIKPENILVGPDGRPKLLDFGIAKLLLEAPPDPDARTTQAGTALLTPLYASPEQTRFEPVTTATDIHALGGLLYELLTGQPPFADAEDDLVALWEAIRHQIPDPPSARSPFSRKLAGDLDAIVLRAMDKNPDRRYPSADALAEDLARYLEGHPVRARRITWSLRLGRFVARHRWAVAAAAILFATLAGSTGLALVLLERAERARIEAVEARQQAELEAHRARLTGAGATLAAGRVEAARAALEEAPPGRRSWAWRHLWARLEPASAVWTEPPALAAALLPDRRLLRVTTDGLHWSEPWTSAPDEGSVQLDEPVTLARAAPGGRHLALLHEPRGQGWTVRSTKTGQVSFLRTLATPGLDVAVSADGAIGAAVTDTELVVAGNEPRLGFTVPHDLKRAGVALSADGRVGIVVGRKDGQQGYRWWTLAEGELSILLGRDVLAGAVSPDGRWVATAEADAAVRLRNRLDGRVLRRYRLEGEVPRAVAFDVTGERLAVGTEAGSLWSFAVSGEDGRRGAPGRAAPLETVAVEPGGEVLSVDAAGAVRLWELGSAPAPTRLRGHLAPPVGGFFALQGELVVSAASDGVLRLWDALGGRALAAFPLEDRGLEALIGAPSGARWAAVGPDGVGVGEWAAPWRLRPLVPGRPAALAFSPDETRLATLDAVGRLRLISVDTGETVATALVPGALELAFSPDGRHLAAAGPGSIQLLDGVALSTGARFTVAGGAVLALAWPADGSALASGSGGGQLALHDVGSGTTRALEPAPAGVTALAFGPEGRQLFAGTEVGEVRVLDVAAGRWLTGWTWHSGPVRGLGFSPTGEQLLSVAGEAALALGGTHPWPVRREAAARLDDRRRALEDEVPAWRGERPDLDAQGRWLWARQDLDEATRRAALTWTLKAPPPSAGAASPPPPALWVPGGDAHGRVGGPEIALRMQATFTLEAWVRPDGGEAATQDFPLSLRTLVNKEGEYQIALDATGRLYWIVAGGAGWRSWVDVRYAAPPGRWTHVALVRTPAELRFFVDGVLVQRRPAPERVGDHHPELDELRLGGRQHTPSGFRGDLDEVRLWRSARTADQIARGLDRPPSPGHPDLIAAWRFDQNDGEVVLDETGRHPLELRGGASIR